MFKDRDRIAKELVDYHVRAEDGIVYAARYARANGDRPDDPIRLLEVNRATVPVGIAPVWFGASEDVPLPVVIIEVTEEEFLDIQSGKLSLPEGWDECHELHAMAA